MAKILTIDDINRETLRKTNEYLARELLARPPEQMGIDAVTRADSTCDVCGGCTVALDCPYPWPPCRCNGDPENVLPGEY